jgi:hypothetical protein
MVLSNSVHMEPRPDHFEDLEALAGGSCQQVWSKPIYTRRMAVKSDPTKI